MRYILAAVLAFSAAAHAQELLRLKEFSDGTLYVHTRQLELNPQPRAWAVVDYKAPRDGVRSARLLVRLDCRAQRVEVHETTLFQGAKATGRALQENGYAGWIDAAPGTAFDAMLTGLCR